MDRIYYSSPFHCSQIDGRPIANALRRSDGAINNIAYVGPVPDLLAASPNFEWVLFNKRPSNHGNHSVIFLAPLPINGEVSARGCFHSPIFDVCLQGHLAHELRPAVHVVGIKWGPHHVFGEKKVLRRILLPEVWVDTSGRRVNDLLDLRLLTGEEECPVQGEIRRAGGLV